MDEDNQPTTEDKEDRPPEEAVEPAADENVQKAAGEDFATESLIPDDLTEPAHEEPAEHAEVPQATGEVIEVGEKGDDQVRKQKGEDLEADFFEKGEDKPKVVEEIAGMTAVAEEEGEEGAAEPPPEKKESQVIEVRPVEEVEAELLMKEDGDQDMFEDRESVYTTLSKPDEAVDKMKESLSKYERLPSDSRRMARKSMKSKSINYDMLPRITSEQDLTEMFDLGLDEDKQIQFYDYDDEEEEEEEMSVAESEAPPLDREPYYEKHEVITKQLAESKIRNFILQKKLAIFFKRRKMEHVLKETAEQQFETIQNYGRKLDTYGELLELDERERTRITSEIEANRKQREEKFQELEKLFATMQNREKDVGTGLINTKTGNTIPDKVVERFIRRQKQTMDQVCSMRLTFIKLKGMVQEKLDTIATLDKIGENLYLIDYEQLKMENRSHADKIEERDEELTRLRSKCQNTIQVLAHIREKSAALETDLDDLQDDLNSVQENATQVRETLNYLKQRRDHFRHMTNKLREDSGLLTQPTLLEDMEKSMADVNSLSEELDHLLEEHKTKTKQIRNIRKHIEIQTEGFMRREPVHKSQSKTKVSKNEPQIYKGRPCLYMPTLPKNAFDHLKDVKPRAANLPKKKH